MTGEEFFHALYDSFNRRDIEATIAAMAPDVKWANGFEGGFEHGRDAVRDYWKRQFEQVDPRVTPLRIESDGDRTTVKVHQLVKDLDGRVIGDSEVTHIFRRKNGLIESFEIGGAGEAEN